jgi:peptidoglycan/LPS O-acetylase OafA/YrhL
MRIFSSIIAAIIIVKAISQQKYFLNRMFKMKSVKYLGKISYGVYLYHWFISYLLLDSFSDYWATVNLDFLGSLSFLKYQKYIFSFLFFFVLTIGVSSLSFYLIEKPLLKLKKYF